MITIVIGCDATGKTTLCNKLSKETGAKIIHLGKPKSPEEIKNMYKMYVDLISNNDNVIFDRFFYCEQVYGPIYRGGSAINSLQQRELEKMLIAKGVEIHYCYADPETIVKRFRITGEDFVTTEDEVFEILNGYDKVLGTIRDIPIYFNRTDE